MNVLMVTGSYPPQPCGVGDYTHRLVEELRRAGIAVSVATTADPRRTEHAGLVLEATGWSARAWRRGLGGLPLASFDLMHVQYPARFYGFTPTQALLTFVARSAAPRLPRIVTFHEYTIVHPLRRLTIGALAAGSDAVTVTDEVEEAAFRRSMPWLARKLHRIPMASTIPVVPLSAGARLEVRAAQRTGGGDLLIAYFGFLHPNKGIELLLDAFALLYRREPAARLLMLSRFEPEADPYHGALRRKAAGLGIADAVRWAGYLPPAEVSRHLGASDIAFLPFAEGVSMRRLSFLTAMSHAMPVVTTRGAAGLEALGLRNGENVLAAEAGATAEATAALLARLAGDPELRSAVGRRAREWSGPFQWEAVAARTIGLYEQVLRMKGISR